MPTVFVTCFTALRYSFVPDDMRSIPSCHIITRDIELVGRRRRTTRPRVCRCCPPWFTSSTSETADCAALYDYNHTQRTISGADIAGKRLRRLPRCLIPDHAPLPPLLPPPPPPSRDRHSACADPPSSDDLAWTRLGGIDHDVYMERCPHVAVHCPSSSARHLLLPTTTSLGDAVHPGSAVHYCTRNQLVSTDSEQSVPTSSSTSAELQLYRPVDKQPDSATVS